MALPPDRTMFDDAWRGSRRHQPFFCEENVWQLLREPALPRPAAAVFVINSHGSVAMWGQRQAVRDPVVWDYHVVALLPAARLVLDLDDREHAAWPVQAWLERAFRPGLPAALQPRFRIVPAADFLAVFSSDRSHMVDAGRPQQPFPPWPAPFQPARGMNLQRFRDLDDPIAGVVTDGPGLLAFGAS